MFQKEWFALILILFCACGGETLTPKPRGYPRVVFPEKGYQTFNEKYCHFSFEYPKYATVEKDSLFFREKPVNDCWFNVKIPDLNAEIHCSYYPIDAKNSFDKLRGDAFTLANKHDIKADYIDELPIRKPDGTIGYVFNIEGGAASPFQFFITDSTRHFLRGSLYYQAKINADSLRPINEFLKVDLIHLVNTFKWNQ
jgi:gliding motility-associated lipoprotein GldD